MQDFALGLSILSRGTIAEKLKWTFTLYDINRDGIITRGEMTDIVTAIYELAGSPTAASAAAASASGQPSSQLEATTSSSSSSSHYPHLHLPHLIHGHHHQQQQQRQLDENIIRAKVERIFQVSPFPRNANSSMLSDVEWVKETFPGAIATLDITLKYQGCFWSVIKELFYGSRKESEIWLISITGSSFSACAWLF